MQQDYAEAAKWYRHAAAQGEAQAQCNLGILYTLGHGVPQNDAEAAKWYRLAAQQGNAAAQFSLGNLYPEMARAVRARGGHYVFKLKANHGPLLAAAKAAFAAAETEATLTWTTTEDDANARIERRHGCVFPVRRTAPAFPGLALFGRIDSVRTKRGGKTETKTHYLVMSQRLSA